MDQDNLCLELCTFLRQLETEIGAFTSETLIWTRPHGINNSPGHITLHLVGNLQHWIGALLLNNGYKRNRPLEFSSDPVPRAELLGMIRQTLLLIAMELPAFLQANRGELYPQPFDNKTISLYGAITHLVAHLAYHCGQVNYFRRLLDPAIDH